jgi:hypothetical protein
MIEQTHKTDLAMKAREKLRMSSEMGLADDLDGNRLARDFVFGVFELANGTSPDGSLKQVIPNLWPSMLHFSVTCCPFKSGFLMDEIQVEPRN